ncbi:hypothetical protein LuPra_03416 [Luteitalea pratensis]|uniref:Fibronectin type-III domain-containing protein n=2 Tax=Luteitalea pratensis TaxID=1855912 RepID=A0A143PNF6_LUTPR|nr:hypothetical protein LuPra_03416 [Luteitalea pratensis]
MTKYTIQLGLVALLAASAACSSNNNPMSPSATPGAGTVAAVPEGTPTLKANTPGSPSPGSGATTELGPQNTLPVTLSVSTAVATHANAVALSHRFQLFEGSTLLAEPLVPAGGGGRTSWTVTTQLKFDTTYTWRVRAELTDGYAAWSSNWTFKTAAAPVSGASRTPDPPAGSRLPLPDRSRVVQAAFSARPDLVSRSCQDRGGTWEFMDYLVDELRKEDNRWGYNGKRGNANDPSQDIVDYHWGGGPSENSTGVYIIDIMLGHCGSPSPAWIDQTGVTASSGTIGRWTGRGRFTN